MESKFQSYKKSVRSIIDKGKKSISPFISKVKEECINASAERVVTITLLLITTICYSIYYNFYKNPIIPFTLTVCVFDATNGDTLMPIQNASLTVADYSVIEHTDEKGCVTLKVNIRKEVKLISLNSFKGDYKPEKKNIQIPIGKKRDERFETRFHLKHKGLPQRLSYQSIGEYSLLNW